MSFYLSKNTITPKGIKLIKYHSVCDVYTRIVDQYQILDEIHQSKLQKQVHPRVYEEDNSKVHRTGRMTFGASKSFYPQNGKTASPFGRNLSTGWLSTQITPTPPTLLGLRKCYIEPARNRTWNFLIRSGGLTVCLSVYLHVFQRYDLKMKLNR
ncbi:hypothetical protein AVEN_146176-1 [Araneus ventricosus]|uniref:Uncharacterized protein n=1 Tax=Araneus ventricosus TaxID=182803 RepID=A0A4Y2CLV4_ARAVE|nr:hypothetical protein AVEN_146176-1 [Araneus ventricosus]